MLGDKVSRVFAVVHFSSITCRFAEDGKGRDTDRNACRKGMDDGENKYRFTKEH